ncbi:hypothetical protein [Allostreptomyces psammosilenae]|uniref:H+/Cl- antiporter ClcA n=1 Tax=Allostreptomyces psammosilenae TaxID=1892865 RepID=A0A853A3Q9_9ACTN|nr:hypothetical protein [Allostreptomyces psammosilenae]NYI08110.1 H+/Cl- antiporter ClcA [Allostreptomyces psammosilenae]
MLAITGSLVLGALLGAAAHLLARRRFPNPYLTAGTGAVGAFTGAAVAAFVLGTTSPPALLLPGACTAALLVAVLARPSRPPAPLPARAARPSRAADRDRLPARPAPSRPAVRRPPHAGPATAHRIRPAGSSALR